MEMPRKKPQKKAAKKPVKKTAKKPRTKAKDHSSRKSFAQARARLKKDLGKLSKQEKSRVQALASGLTEKEAKILWKYYMDVETRARAGKVFQGIAKRYNVTSGDLELAAFLRTTGLVKPGGN